MKVAPAPALERITVTLPGGFDPDRHRDILQGKIVDKYGTGFTMETIGDSTATAVRQVARPTADPGCHRDREPGRSLVGSAP